MIIRAIEEFDADNPNGVYASYSSYSGNIWIKSSSWNDGELGAYIGNLSNTDRVWLAATADTWTRPIGSTDIYTGLQCDGNGLKTGSTTDVVVMAQLSSGSYYCVNAN